MFDDARRVMFTALHEAGTAQLPAGHPCLAALAAAAAAPSPAAVGAAQTALAALPEAERTALMAAVHARLRGHPRAWLALWAGGPARH